MSKITFLQKSDLIITGIADQNKIVAKDINEIKSVVNFNDDAKTEKGGYTGSAQDLKDAIDNAVFDGIKTYQTEVDLLAVSPVPSDGTPAKVANNTVDPTKNGNWSVVSGAWVQDTSVVASISNSSDIKTVGDELQLNNRDKTLNSLGYKFIREGFDFTSIPSGYDNSIWEIRGSHDLSSATITLPSNVTLFFNGGYISNGTITGDDTRVKSDFVKIFGSDITFAGTWVTNVSKPEWFGAMGDGVTDDTQPILDAIDFLSDNGTLLFNYNRSYLVSTIPISKSMEVDLNKSTLTSSNDTISSALLNVGSVSKFKAYNGELNYTGEFYTVSYLGSEVGLARNGIESDADVVEFRDLEITNFSSDGIKVVNNVTSEFFNIKANNNGYAGIRVLDGSCNILSCFTNNNGGSNTVGGYGIIVNVGQNFFYGSDTVTQNSATVIGCHAHENMTRGIDSHVGTNIQISLCHAYNNGTDSVKWAGSQSSAVQIRVVNDITSAIITNNTCYSKDDTLALINFISNSDFTYIEDCTISNNDLTIKDYDVYGIMVTPYNSKDIIINNNKVRFENVTTPTGIIVTSDALSYFGSLSLSNNVLNGRIEVRNHGANTITSKLNINHNNCERIFINTVNATNVNLINVLGNVITDSLISVNGKTTDILNVSFNVIKSVVEPTSFPYVDGVYVINCLATIIGNYIDSTRNKIYVSGSSYVNIDNNLAKGDSSDWGIHVEASDDVTISNNKLNNCSRGVSLSATVTNVQLKVNRFVSCATDIFSSSSYELLDESFTTIP